MKMTSRRKRFLTMGLILFLGWMIILIVQSSRASANMRKMKQLQSELFAKDTKISPEERKQKFDQLREVSKNLTTQQRQQLRNEGQKRQEDELRRYSQLSPKDKVNYLDQRINQMETMRKQNQGNNGPQAKGNGPSGANGPPGAKGPSNGFGGRTGGGSTKSAEEREKARKQRLDNTTPELRALRNQFRQDMEKRRQQRGLPNNPPKR
jgi:hypothetical protein